VEHTQPLPVQSQKPCTPLYYSDRTSQVSKLEAHTEPLNGYTRPLICDGTPLRSSASPRARGQGPEQGLETPNVRGGIRSYDSPRSDRFCSLFGTPAMRPCRANLGGRGSAVAWHRPLSRLGPLRPHHLQPAREPHRSLRSPASSSPWLRARCTAFGRSHGSTVSMPAICSWPIRFRRYQQHQQRGPDSGSHAQGIIDHRRGYSTVYPRRAPRGYPRTSPPQAPESPQQEQPRHASLFRAVRRGETGAGEGTGYTDRIQQLRQGFSLGLRGEVASMASRWLGCALAVLVA